MKCFALDLIATETAQLSSVSLRPITLIFDKLRVKIAWRCLQEAPFSGTVEVDESYFGPRCLAQFNGVSKTKFYLYLKKAEFRFNHRNHNLYHILLKRFRDDPL
ncbi:MAG: hypothetical protein MK198_06915 [Gracilimonas sp.]|nr:hypothetical protein [Gracilimonas sp.]